jgi:3-hydroxybutyryl-CoA dehydrogenase
LRSEEATMKVVAVIGAGTMGHGIAQVFAAAGLETRLHDATPELVERGMARIRANLDEGLARGKVTADARDATLAKLQGMPSLEAAVAGADLVIEAIPEDIALKRALFARVEAVAPPQAIFATNTSSLPVGRVAEGLADPGRVIGAHFFNPVHLMPLLEIVVAATTRPEVVDAILALGAKIGKETITVRDTPGFATSRLGVCLGMEAIRMVESGVASAEDIDKAMVLGYRHPMGPLKLTDVRLNIGEHLARELGNPAFEPPDLLRRLVAEGKLGKKTGQGFYRWP